MPPLSLGASIERWPLAEPFRIAGYEWTFIDVLVVSLECAACVGRGEAFGVYYRNETPSSLIRQIRSVEPQTKHGLSHGSLQRLLPPGGARNAIDCALWDLEAKLAGTTVWRYAGFSRPRPLVTTFTLGAGAPEAMATSARGLPAAKAIKLKLTGDPVDRERVQAVREARPDARLLVDGNQGFTRPALEKLMPVLETARVELIEQPFPVGQEALLDAFSSRIPIAADESVQSLVDLPAVLGRFGVVNVKLDKSGGLTEALAMVAAARALGLEVMVSNMPCTSLAMAPAFLLAQLAQIVDLDGPTLLQTDRPVAVSFADGMISCPEALWGS